ncbi:retrovirus-related Pol polyprotein from transposon 17.6, partial [Nephila pilipes]
MLKKSNIFFNLAKAINLDEVDLSHITDQDIKHNLKQVLDTYTPQKRKTTDVMMKIVLTDESPIHSKPRRLAANEKTFVDSQIQNWLDAGIIKESVNSPFSSPIVLVEKKNGDYRLCIDYRRLNRKIIKDSFP